MTQPTIYSVFLALALVSVSVTAGAADAAKESSAAKKSDKPTKADVAKAEQDRKKPLQRCDELKDKAQLECLEKARQRVVEAREKRQAAGKN